MSTQTGVVARRSRWPYIILWIANLPIALVLSYFAAHAMLGHYGASFPFGLTTPASYLFAAGDVTTVYTDGGGLVNLGSCREFEAQVNSMKLDLTTTKAQLTSSCSSDGSSQQYFAASKYLEGNATVEVISGSGEMVFETVSAGKVYIDTSGRWDFKYVLLPISLVLGYLLSSAFFSFILSLVLNRR